MDTTKHSQSKIKRKMGRCLSILKQDYPDIHASKETTKFVFIGNAGLTTKADESSLTELINSVGCGLESIILVPEKSYSFASFFREKDAEIFVSSANGQKNVPGSSAPVYLSYVNKVPAVSTSLSYEFPPGLEVIENFISEKEEVLLFQLIDWKENPLDKAEGSVLKHRQVRHFGYEFQYGSNSVDKNKPLMQKIPDALSHIMDRIVERGIMPALPDQLTVNYYLPGQGIPPHVDTHSSFTDIILSLSIGSGITMDFRHVGSSSIDPCSLPHCAVYLNSRSLCVMSGPARYEWSHGICPRKTDIMPSLEGNGGLQIFPRKERISFTFRKIRNGICHCQNHLVCDEQSYIHKETDLLSSECDFTAEDASDLEKKHVLSVYDQIADHFSDTRHKPWPHVFEFVSSLHPGSFLLDVGCGNGKYLGHNKKVTEIGCDTSFELLKICRNRSFEALQCNCLQLPYRSCVFDAAICIAVIHHLASEERRIAAIKEIVRILRAGGRALIYVWAMEQKRGKNISSYLKQNKATWKASGEDNTRENSNLEIRNHSSVSSDYLPVHTNRTEFIEQDMLVPWKMKSQKKGVHAKYKSSDLKGAENIPNESSLCSVELPDSVRGNNNAEPFPVFHRYYHVFKQSELESLCTKVEEVNILKSYYDEGNWCVIFEKKLA